MKKLPCEIGVPCCNYVELEKVNFKLYLLIKTNSFCGIGNCENQHVLIGQRCKYLKRPVISHEIYLSSVPTGQQLPKLSDFAVEIHL